VFEGHLKSLSAKNGYGFIKCDEAKKLYDRDVWVDSDALPESVKVDSRVKFNITLSSKGHPQAKGIKLCGSPGE